MQVIDEADVAAAALDPLRARVLEALAEPGSASSVAAALAEPRQKVNYHLRASKRWVSSAWSRSVPAVG